MPPQDLSFVLSGLYQSLGGAHQEKLLSWLSAFPNSVDAAVLSLVGAGIITHPLPSAVVAGLVGTGGRMSPDEVTLLRSVLPDMSSTAVPLPANNIDESNLLLCCDLGFRITFDCVRRALTEISAHNFPRLWRSYATFEKQQGSLTPSLLTEFLRRAISAANATAVRLLVEEGADATLRTIKGDSVLHLLANSDIRERAPIEGCLAALFEAPGVSQLVDAPNAFHHSPALLAAGCFRGWAASILVSKYGASPYNATKTESIFTAPFTPQSFAPCLVADVPKSLIDAVIPGGDPLLHYLIKKRFESFDSLLSYRSDWDFNVRDPLSGDSFLRAVAKSRVLSYCTAIANWALTHDPSVLPALLPILLSHLPLESMDFPYALVHKILDRARATENFEIDNREHSLEERTAIHSAAFTRNYGLIDNLLSLNASAALVESSGATPLICFAKGPHAFGKLSVLVVPMELIASTKAAGMLNHRDLSGETALSYAIAMPHPAGVSLSIALLNAGAEASEAEVIQIKDQEAR